MYSPEKLSHSTQDWNGVLYCNGDPVNKVDPTGQFGADFWGMINQAGAGQQVMNEVEAIGEVVVDSAVITGGVLVGSAAVISAPVVVAALAPEVAGLSLALTIEANVIGTGVGMYVARNPKATQEAIKISASIINDLFFDSVGSTPSAQPNSYSMLKASFKFGNVLGEGVNEFIDSTKEVKD